MACDFAINPMLVDAGLTPKDVLLDHRFRGMSLGIYSLLAEEENQDHLKKGARGRTSSQRGGENRATPEQMSM